MPFREPEGGMANDFGPERDYMPPNNRSYHPSSPGRVGPNQDLNTCFGSLSCLGDTFQRIKNWIFTLGKGYIYLIVGVIIMAILPLFLVSSNLKNKRFI